MKENHKLTNEPIADIESAALVAYSGKRVLVTGAAGSIGRQLILQLARFAPLKIVALDKDENGLYELDQELSLKRVAISVEPQVADIRDTCRLEGICQTFVPQVIFHAAAYKHVPLMELHPSEAILSNVMGTKNLLDVVAGFGAERFIFISTDKAVNPVSVMGATKRIGEMLVQEAARSGRVQAASVRFGNVLGTRGSVVPLFQRQIAEGGPVTVTHPDVVRHFMTMQQAVRLILAAGCEAQHGETFMADPGRPRNIGELAREMILLAGLEAGKDIEIRFVGLRAGERLVEELFSRSERVRKSRFGGLSVIDPPAVDQRALAQNISQLVQTVRSSDPRGIYSILGLMGLGYKRAAQPPTESAQPPAPLAMADDLPPLRPPSPVLPLRKSAAT